MHVTTRQMIRDVAIAFAPGLLVTGIVFACTPTQLTQVQDASDKRDTICRFVSVWAPDQPELKEVHRLCEAGAELKAIAAAYAGCPTEVR